MDNMTVVAVDTGVTFRKITPVRPATIVVLVPLLGPSPFCFLAFNFTCTCTYAIVVVVAESVNIFGDKDGIFSGLGWRRLLVGVF